MSMQLYSIPSIIPSFIYSIYLLHITSKVILVAIGNTVCPWTT